MKRRAKLTVEQVTELQQRVKNKESASVEIRWAQAIILVNGETDGVTIKSVTGFDKKHAFKLKKKYQEKGIKGITAKKRKVRRLLTKGQMRKIEKMVRATKPSNHGVNSEFWSVPILAEIILRLFGVTYKSKTSYYLIFKESGFTYHKPDKRYHAQDPAKIAAWRKDAVPVIEAALADPNTVVLMGDEMILTTQTRTQKAWLLASDYAKIEESSKRERRCIYGFLNQKTGQEHAFKTSHCNSEMTCKVLKKLDNLYPTKKIMIVWDNASWHKSKDVKALLKERPGRFHLMPFPPYAPEENPQEHVWKAGRSVITNNRYINNIEAISDDLVAYYNGTLFPYKFGHHGVSI